MSKTSYLTIAALTVAFALPSAAPAAAQAGAQRPAGQAAQGAQQQPTRANLTRSLEANFKAVDTNGDGSLSSPELAAAEGKVQQRESPAFATHEVVTSPTNKDGQLSKASSWSRRRGGERAPMARLVRGSTPTRMEGYAEEYRAPVSPISTRPTQQGRVSASSAAKEVSPRRSAHAAQLAPAAGRGHSQSALENTLARARNRV